MTTNRLPTLSCPALMRKLQPFELECQRLTEQYIYNADAPFVEATRTFEALLQQLYLFSCCFWGCHGNEHTLEYLAARVSSHVIASRRLIMTGYYDEALSLIRSVGEIANLLNLFWADSTYIRSWLDSEDRSRWKEFRPAAVRSKLEELQWMIPFDEEHYGRLCEVAVHPTPATRPNDYRDDRRPTLGAVFQEHGFIMASWELYWSLAVAAGPIAKLALFPREQAEKMVELTIPLFEAAAARLGT